jgi:hypothetical protein
MISRVVRFQITFWVLILVCYSGPVGHALWAGEPVESRDRAIATFSIVARDADTGEMGVALLFCG